MAKKSWVYCIILICIHSATHVSMKFPSPSFLPGKQDLIFKGFQIQTRVYTRREVWEPVSAVQDTDLTIENKLNTDFTIINHIRIQIPFLRENRILRHTREKCIIKEISLCSLKLGEKITFWGYFLYPWSLKIKYYDVLMQFSCSLGELKRSIKIVIYHYFKGQNIHLSDFPEKRPKNRGFFLTPLNKQVWTIYFIMCLCNAILAYRQYPLFFLKRVFSSREMKPEHQVSSRKKLLTQNICKHTTYT